jgi:hypothetical protein
MGVSEKPLKSDILKLIRPENLQPIFQDLKFQKISFDPRWHGFCNAESKVVLNQLHGEFPSCRDHVSIRHGAGKILRRVHQSIFSHFRSRKELELELPENPLVFENAGGKVAVVISGKVQCVVKIEGHVHAPKFCEITKKSWQAFKSVNLESHLPEYLGGGETSTAGVYYTKTRFCPNKPPLFRSYKGNAWPRVLETRVLPILKEFHSRNGFQLLSGPEWARLIAAKYENRTMPEPMRQAMLGSFTNLQAYREKLMPVGMISADLQPQNIHFFDVKTVFLDWSNIETAALLIDVVCDVFYRAMASPDIPNSVAYWEFLCGKRPLAQLPKVLRDFYQVWKRWVGDWMGLEVSERMYRLQLEGICWDWMGTMTHPWLQDGSLWRKIRFPDSFIAFCSHGKEFNLQRQQSLT